MLRNDHESSSVKWTVRHNRQKSKFCGNCLYCKALETSAYPIAQTFAFLLASEELV